MKTGVTKFENLEKSKHVYILIFFFNFSSHLYILKIVKFGVT